MLVGVYCFGEMVWCYEDSFFVLEERSCLVLVDSVGCLWFGWVSEGTNFVLVGDGMVWLRRGDSEA